jgi:hypothetical protein
MLKTVLCEEGPLSLQEEKMSNKAHKKQISLFIRAKILIIG